MPEIVAENTMAVPSAPPVETRAERLRNFWSDFHESWVAVGALIVIAVLLFLSFGAPLVSPQDPYDMAALDWLDAFLRPGTEGSGGYVHLLGTDNAGRDMLSAIFYGLRTSFGIGLSAGALAPVSSTHLRAHETKANLECRLLLEKKNNQDRDMKLTP